MTKIISKRGKQKVEPKVHDDIGMNEYWPFVHIDHEPTPEDMEVLEQTLQDVDITYIPFEDDEDENTHSLRKVAEVKTIDVIMHNQILKVVVR
jgi:hypothetical protein